MHTNEWRGGEKFSGAASCDSHTFSVPLLLHDRKLTDLHSILQGNYLLLLLLQQVVKSVHMLECELQHNSLLQVSQSLKQEESR